MNDTFLVTGVGCNYFSKLFWVLYRVREKKRELTNGREILEIIYAVRASESEL